MAKSKIDEWKTDEGLILIEGWARDGLTEEQIAHNMGIRRETLWEWKNKNANIGNALKKGKEVVDRIVENALFKRAVGYDVEETKVEIMPDGTKKGIQTKRHIPGDTTAQIFWLKNRRPDLWRDKQNVEATIKQEDDLLSQAFMKLRDELDGDK